MAPQQVRTKKRNGRKAAENTAVPTCVHSPYCEFVQTIADLQAQIQTLAEAVGAGFQAIDSLIEKRFLEMKVQVGGVELSLGLRITKHEEREEEWLAQLNDADKIGHRVAEASRIAIERLVEDKLVRSLPSIERTERGHT